MKPILFYGGPFAGKTFDGLIPLQDGKPWIGAFSGWDEEKEDERDGSVTLLRHVYQFQLQNGDYGWVYVDTHEGPTVRPKQEPKARRRNEKPPPFKF